MTRLSEIVCSISCLSFSHYPKSFLVYLLSGFTFLVKVRASLIYQIFLSSSLSLSLSLPLALSLPRSLSVSLKLCTSLSLYLSIYLSVCLSIYLSLTLCLSLSNSPAEGVWTGFAIRAGHREFLDDFKAVHSPKLFCCGETQR